jgi:glutathione S-transferase
MKLYGAALSPYVRKVQSYLAERGMEAENLSVGIGSDDPGFAAASPLKKMPALQDGDFGIADSSAILTYLEAKYPGSGLVPEDAEGKAWVHFHDKFADTILGASGTKVFFNRIVLPKFMGREGNEEIAAEGEAELAKHYAYLESALAENGYLLASGFSLADISMASLMGNVRLLGLGPDEGVYPRLAAWVETVFARPAIAGPYTHAEKIFARTMG